MKDIKFFKKILIFSSILIVVLFVFYYFIFSDISRRNKHSSELQNTIEFQNQKDQNVLSTKREIQMAGNNIEKISNSIIAKDGDVSFIELIESIARRNGMEISIDSLSLSDDPQLTGSNLTFLNIRGGIEGGWTGNFNFLRELESLPYNIVIKKYSLTNSDDGIKLGKWQSVFEIQVLKYK